MLLIFDLDDTLINTFHSVTVLAYEALLEKVQKEDGVGFCPKTALERLIQLRATSRSSVTTLKVFFKEYKLQCDIQKALDFIYCYNDYSLISLNPGVKQFLTEQKAIKKVIVTKGVQKRQLEKIQKSPLSDFMFNKVVVVDSHDKSVAYKECIRAFKPEKSILIADRAEDFKNTKELITKRVLFNPPYFEDPKSVFFADLEISNLKDLTHVL